MNKHPSPDAVRDAMPAGKARAKAKTAKQVLSLRDLYDAHRGKVSDKWSIYLSTYDHIFSEYRDRPVRILEIGVQNGGSLEIWQKYFPNAEIIVGCDVNLACGNLVFDSRKIKIAVGDANTDQTERDIMSMSEKYDIIIDDGSHLSSDIIRSFARYFPHLSEGGMYIAEDLHCSYWQEFEGGLYDPLSSMSFFKRLLDVVNHEHWGLDRRRVDALATFADRHQVAFDEASLASVHSVEFLNSLCIVTKLPIPENVLGARNVHGRAALADGSVVPLDDTKSKAIDQTGNPWSLKSTTMEEEIGTNRKLVGRHGARIEAFSSEMAEMREQIRTHKDEISSTRAQVSARDGEIARGRTQIIARDKEIELLQENLSMAHRATSVLLADRDEARSEEIRLHDVLDAVYASTSWRVTKPLRGIGSRVRAIGDVRIRLRRLAIRGAYGCWHNLPLSIDLKRKLKRAAFSTFPSLFGVTNAYRAWRSMEAPQAPVGSNEMVLRGALVSSGPIFSPEPVYVPLLDAPPLLLKPVRVIAFYLPQFHQIPENDEWWGQGFTEWTNVRPAEPQFIGHHQPHVPDSLGYYDLLDTAVQRHQIELAKLYGVEGFCFYFYWFAGKRLLERPLENWLADKSLDMPFCVCWANENWSRRWDGMDQEILIAQDHSPQDDLAFIAEVAPYLRDPRYIRIDGKPLLLVYRPSLLPAAAETARRWRTWCRENGIGEIFLAYTQSFESVPPHRYGFDAAVEFPPNNSAPPNVTHTVTPLHEDFATTVYDWSIFPQRSETYSSRKYKLFRSVCPGWDNTARRKRGGTVFINNTPALYRRWLDNVIEDTLAHVSEPSERLVFVNAWNEWAEGAHLEPDSANGHAYLQATRDALEAANRKCKSRIVVVSHDAHPHGAQLLALNLAKGFKQLGFEPDLIVLGDGPLLGRFAHAATVHRIDLPEQGDADVLKRLAAIRNNGAEVAVVNTTVSGKLVPLLKQAGFRTVCLVHELPGILASYGLADAAAAIIESADTVVFPAEIVKAGFEEFVGQPVSQSVVRPQGLYLRTPYLADDRQQVREAVRARLGLSTSESIILCAGYADHRKGLDLFVDACLKVMASRPDAVAVWVGHVDTVFHAKQMRRVKDAGLEGRFVFVGLVENPQEYYFAADIYALTSREDPFPSVVLEALDATVPVVAFEGAGGFQDLLKRDCGILVQAFDTDAMAKAITNLLDNAGEARRLASVGRDIVRQEFSFSHYLHDLLIYAEKPLPRVSVIVPNYNYARYLGARLSSIVEQTTRPYELIVLDDASTDESVEVIEKFLAGCDIPCRLVVNAENSGSVFRQWMRGVEMARGDYVWIAEADDLADPDFLAELLPAFEREEVVMSYCQSRQMDGAGRVLSEHYLDYVSDIDRSRWTKPYVVEGRQEIAEALYLKNTIPNVSGVLFRREALRQALSQNLDEIASYRNAGDWVAYLRLLEKGDIAFHPHPFNSHRRHQSSVTIGSFNASHLQEIARVQSETIARFHLGAAAQESASAYAQRLYAQFGLATGEQPRFEGYSELRNAGQGQEN
ncbi:glycosyltransferase [Mesorhizobium sp. M7A.F.Ca.CA.001.09.2.1]|uniref:glycoside hydrolase family 99-like domain-containing protein n=2 Tax=Mesorhizobium TaxID=68287 RepID=UPI000FCA9F38|nr:MULTISPECIES: glycoside hydrolase family 99-like domain-containing protein [unclassified Mesorhizobium]RUY57908.1 glycosyltransferase [Mesorhizobium sp. M7A.F.Ca.CA.001.13.2.1]RUY69325.1 glycosyltransferase [Mesorhizobium sp. M7A.F.Ca.CA.001.13.1.1]RUY80726.1 glycosyltransferase [Mesorhizobium sp. M7A.F.Ca.CA.001.09.2.1]RUZ05558.1 glycosyltransferase [Mesorhizobium sp. M7A.F.Ca.CA.001.04.2.1]RUZ26136.1 glycosyltransferase [Mesorhizobium sp. M7A.F.Ca.CA.001.09.1.1]